MFRISSSGNFNNARSFLNRASNHETMSLLNKYGALGVEALAAHTPVNSGETANSWGYEITKTSKGYRLTWTNDHIVDDVPVAILIQYGHATNNGGYVQGLDYINPALHSLFNDMSYTIWKEVVGK